MRLFELWGIEVKAGLFALFLLAISSLQMAGLAMQYAAVSPGLSFFVGLLMGLAVIASIVAHEYGHALTARVFGVQVDEIVIHLFGGAALMKSPFPSARAELWIALAGPFVSFGIALLGGWIAFDPIFGFMGYSLTKCIGLVGIVNLILGAFNLIPAFPMDGGRVLRATIWSLTNNFSKATRLAAYTGYIFGITWGGMGLLTIFGVLSGSVGEGIWAIFLGAFVAMLSHTEAQRVPKTIPPSNPDQRFLNQEID